MTRRDALLAAGVAGAAAAWAWPALEAGYEGPYDEGLTLCAAWRALEGETLYRDVWSLHPPGTAWLLSGAFRIFGPGLATERGVKLAVLAVTAALVFLLTRLSARTWATAAAALLFVALPTQTLSLRPRDAGLALVAASLLAACVPSARPERRALAAGLLAGATVWFKQDFAVVAAVSSGAVLVLARGRARFLETLLPFAAGLAVGPAALAAALVAQGTLGAFFDQTLRFPATTFGLVRALPLSLRFEQLARAAGEGTGISSKVMLDVAAVPVLFVVALAAVIAAAAVAGRGDADADVRGRVLVASSLGCLLLLAAPWQRADLEHLNPALALALVALAAAAAPVGSGRTSSMPFIRRTSLGLFLLLLLFSAPVVRGRARLFERQFLRETSAGATGLAAAPRWIGLPADVAETARLVARETRPGERVFVGNARHDALTYGAPLVSFLSGRMGATRYDNLHPGVVTTRAAQEEIVRALEARRVRVLVLWDGPPLVEPNASSVPSGVSLLDDWITARAGEIARFGAYRVMKVREPAGPPARRFRTSAR